MSETDAAARGGTRERRSRSRGTPLPFAGRLHVAIAESRGVPAFVSFDRGLDRVLGLNRIEP